MAMEEYYRISLYLKRNVTTDLVLRPCYIDVPVDNNMNYTQFWNGRWRRIA